MNFAQIDVTNSGVVLRAPPPRVAVMPTVVIPGAQEAGLESLFVTDQQGQVVTMRVRGRQVDWPDGFSLLDGARYTVTANCRAGDRRTEINKDRSGIGRMVLRPE